jgi:ADP-ribosylglycohydrolase/protein-tyrosine phosphatase
MSRKPLNLSDVQRDRAIGALLGTAAGDALGAGYTFGPPLPAVQSVGMIGGGSGPLGPGEWTDATSKAIAIAEIGSTGSGLGSATSLDYIVERWAWWARNAKGVGIQTSAVLSAAAPVGLLNLRPHHEPEASAAARAVSALAHVDPDVGDACVLWCAAVRHAVLTGGLDVRIGLRHIDAERRQVWLERILKAERSEPSDFSSTNGGVVAALQAAWSAIVITPERDGDPPNGVLAADRLRLALEAAVRGGGDTGTVAAVAGGLLGAAYGATAVPSHWRLVLRGWPGLNTRGLVNLVTKILNDGEPDRFDHRYQSWRGEVRPQRHPHVDGVWLGGAASLRQLPSGVDAVVSLCRVADGHIPAGVRHLDVRLIDKVAANANLDFVLLDTVRAVEQLRGEGATVFLHGLGGHSRTPAVAALYGARRTRVDGDQALAEVCDVLPDADPNRELRAALRRLLPATEKRNR